MASDGRKAFSLQSSNYARIRSEDNERETSTSRANTA